MVIKGYAGDRRRCRRRGVGESDRDGQVIGEKEDLNSEFKKIRTRAEVI